VDQVIFQIEEQADSQQESLSNSNPTQIANNDLDRSSISNFSRKQTEALETNYSNFQTLQSNQDTFLEETLNQDLDHALKLSASYFNFEGLEAHNEAAFYTITTQSLAICELRKNVNHRSRILYNLALYYYTKAAPQLRHLKSLEDVLELSPEQCSIATYYNNLAFLRFGKVILENRLDKECCVDLNPFEKHTLNTNPSLEPVFTTIEVELLVALNQLDEAFALNKGFSEQVCQNKSVHNAYYSLHNYLIYQASGNTFKAKQKLDEALNAFEQTECKRSLATCHYYLSELFESLGYYNQALEHIKFANRFEAQIKTTQFNLSELERLEFQYRKKIINRKTTKKHNLN